DRMFGGIALRTQIPQKTFQQLVVVQNDGHLFSARVALVLCRILLDNIYRIISYHKESRTESPICGDCMKNFECSPARGRPTAYFFPVFREWDSPAAGTILNSHSSADNDRGRLP